jgi:sensor c-di-GMP phosphodiesterase-like protein
VTRSKATADAAEVVANAVTAAADAAFLAAQSAAATVELAADMAAASGRVVADSSAATQAATDVAVTSTANVLLQAERLRFASMRRVRLARDPLVTALHQALVRSELRLHYQPIYQMETGALAAVEALLRWQHPTRGLLAPAEFLHVAEARTSSTPSGTGCSTPPSGRRWPGREPWAIGRRRSGSTSPANSSATNTSWASSQAPCPTPVWQPAVSGSR